MIEQCLAEGITLIEGNAIIKDGQQFAEHIGAKVGLVEILVRSHFKDIDWQMVEDWVQSGQESNPTTEILYFQGLYSEDDSELSRFATFETAIRADMPDGDMEGFCAGRECR